MSFLRKAIPQPRSLPSNLNLVLHSSGNTPSPMSNISRGSTVSYSDRLGQEIRVMLPQVKGTMVGGY
jgi:hypothetical protein